MKVETETANHYQEYRKQHSPYEENNIENDEGNRFGGNVVDSEKHCSGTSPMNVLPVSYAETLRQTIRKPQS